MLLCCHTHHLPLPLRFNDYLRYQDTIVLALFNLGDFKFNKDYPQMILNKAWLTFSGLQRELESWLSTVRCACEEEKCQTEYF